MAPACSVSAANHNMVTGDRVPLGACGDASGIWTVTVIDASNFDLDDSVRTATVSNGAFRMSENCSGYFAGNTIEDVDGFLDAGGGNFPYGAGFYVQAAGGVIGYGNTFLRTNKQTNIHTLSPGSIGINGATGPVSFDGGWIRDSGYSGIFTTGGTDFFGSVSFGSSLDVANSTESDIRCKSTRNLSFGALLVRPADRRNAVGTNPGVLITDCPDLSIDGLRMPEMIGLQRPFFITSCDRFSIRGVKLRNKAPNHGVASELAYINSCDDGVLQGNEFDNGLSEYTALTLDAVTNTIISGNRSRMTAGGPAKATVRLINTCTETIYMFDNIDHLGRMENLSTGGRMMTMGLTNQTGGKTRQQGDVILHTDPTTGTLGFWHKITASTGGSDWESAAIA